MPGDPHARRESPVHAVVLGVGASRGCPPEELAALADGTLAEAGVTFAQVSAVASATVKADEPAIVRLAADLGVPARFLGAEELAAVPVPTPSDVVASHVGTPSVAEAAALLVAGESGSGSRLLVAKRRSTHATCAVATSGPADPTGDDDATPRAETPSPAPSATLPGAPVPAPSGVGAPARTPHPIEVESYRILRSRLELDHLPPLSRAVTERTVHSVADVAFAETLVLDEDALLAGRAALLAGAPLIVDTRMAAAGITARETIVPLADPRAADRARATGSTRSDAAFRLAAADHPDGAVWAIGNAPTALFALLEEIEAGRVRPALVVGLPVGFVGAADSKAALARSGVPCLTNRGERGGTPVTVAAIHALLFHRDSGAPSA
nr:precorrin-8X methylmutase [Patulibacter minatonensis]